jgi:hypothetical protein
VANVLLISRATRSLSSCVTTAAFVPSKNPVGTGEEPPRSPYSPHAVLIVRWRLPN